MPGGWRAELCRSTRCSAVVSIDYKGRHKHGYGRVPHGRTVPHGRKQLAAGPPSWIPGGVSWAREQGRPARVYSQLGHQLGRGEQGRPSAGQGNRAGPGNGLGNGLGDRPGLGNRVQVLWVTEFIKSLFYIKVFSAIWSELNTQYHLGNDCVCLGISICMR